MCGFLKRTLECDKAQWLKQPYVGFFFTRCSLLCLEDDTVFHSTPRLSSYMAASENADDAKHSVLCMLMQLHV